MGIVNVTPDSFSDGGEAYALDSALARAAALLDDGADIVDVGGESTRPGAAPVTAKEEVRRVLPVIRQLAGQGVLVSVDTRKAVVMEAALEAGARIVNDVTGLAGDRRSLDVVAGSDAALVLMHMRGDPSSMQVDPHYDDPAAEVADWLRGRIRACRDAGIDAARIAVDPGIGFGKTVDHNLDLLARLGVIADLGHPVVVGVSRKSFISRIDRNEPATNRLGGSLAAGLAAVAQGGDILRVHDVAATRQALAVWQAIQRADPDVDANGTEVTAVESADLI